MGLSTHYEENLAALIKALRVQYDSPKAPVSRRRPARLSIGCLLCHTHEHSHGACDWGSSSPPRAARLP